MPVELWGNPKFNTTHERIALQKFWQSMQARFGDSEDLYLILVNYYLGGAELDMTVCKKDAIIVIELKEFAAPFTSTANGRWRAEDGTPVGSNGENPFQQARRYRFRWVNFLSELKNFFPPGKAQSMEFMHVSAFVAISPSLHPDTQNKLPYMPWFRLVGLDELDQAIDAQTSRKLSFSNQELKKLVKEELNLEKTDLTELFADQTPVSVTTPTGVRMIGCFYEAGVNHQKIEAYTHKLADAAGIETPALTYHPAPEKPSSLIARPQTNLDRPYQPVIKALIGRDYCVYSLILSARDDRYQAPLDEVAEALTTINLEPILADLAIAFETTLYTGREVANAAPKKASPLLFSDQSRPNIISRWSGLAMPVIYARWSKQNRHTLLPDRPDEGPAPISVTAQNQIISQALDDLARLEVYYHKLLLSYEYYRRHYDTVETLEAEVSAEINAMREDLPQATPLQLRQMLSWLNKRLIDLSQLAHAVQQSDYTVNANYINLQRQLQDWAERAVADYPTLSHHLLPEGQQIVATLGQFSKRITGLKIQLEEIIRIVHLQLELKP